MPSPFPGMDPYLEGALWPDVHHALAVEIRRQLVARLRSRYTVRLEIASVIERDGDAVSIARPDVKVLAARPPAGESAAAVLTPPLRIPLLLGDPLRVASVQIREASSQRLVTSIEILSPFNKREPGLTEYREKRARFRDAGVAVVEMDLLRRGTRSLGDEPGFRGADYVLSVTRGHASEVEAWPFTLRDSFPLLPVPLLDPDPDEILDTGAALRAVYDDAAYDESIDYSEDPPPPAFDAATRLWMRTLLASRA